MFGISFKPKSAARPLRTIEREVEATRARYNIYKTTGKIVPEDFDKKTANQPLSKLMVGLMNKIKNVIK